MQSASSNCPLVQRLGHLPLEQVIGVRIPGGQPKLFHASTHLQTVRNQRQRPQPHAGRIENRIGDRRRQPDHGHSPAPAEGMSLRSSSTVSITGRSLNRGTRYSRQPAVQNLSVLKFESPRTALRPIPARSILRSDCAGRRDSQSRRTRTRKPRARSSRRPFCDRRSTSAKVAMFPSFS